MSEQSNKFQLRINQEEQESDEKVQKILRDIEDYNRLQSEVDREEHDY